MAIEGLCNDLIKGMNPACAALKKVAGVNQRVWITQKSQTTGYTADSLTKDIKALAMDTDSGVTSTMKKFIGKKFKNNASFPLVPGDNVNTFNHTVALVLFYSTSLELETLQALANANDVIVIVEGNDGKIMVYGIDLGLNASAGEGGTGTLLQDNTGYTMTLSGEQINTPRYFNVTTGATLAANIIYLDSISE